MEKQKLSNQNNSQSNSTEPRDAIVRIMSYKAVYYLDIVSNIYWIIYYLFCY